MRFSITKKEELGGMNKGFILSRIKGCRLNMK
jgi:hypothetical protein